MAQTPAKKQKVEKTGDPWTKTETASKKTFKKIDLHTHVLPEDIPNFHELFGYGDFIRLDHHCPCKAKMIKGDTFFREIEDNCYRTEPRLRDCDEDGVNVQVLSTVPVMFNYWAKPKDCLMTCKFLNDHIAKMCKDNPKRFIGLGTLPLQSPELAIQEAERCIKELGLVGFEIGSHINDWALSDPALFPIFQKMEQLDACVFVHPWDMMGFKVMSKYWLPWLVGMPSETSFAICSMIFGGVFEKLPKLRVAFAHGGGSFPATIGRIEHGWRVRPDLCAIDNEKNPRDYCGKFWVDSLLHDEDAMRNAVNLLGHKKICCGSDYPFPLGEVATEYSKDQYPGKLIMDMSKDLTPEQQQDMLWYNCLDFLGVKEERFL